MKRRAETLLLALALAAGAFWLQALAVPESVFACSCIPPRNLAAVAARGDSIVIATVEDRNTINVTHTFAGEAEPGQMQIHGLGPDEGACQEGALAGETWLFSLTELGYTTTCALNGRIGTDEGDALVAEAVKRFGPILPDTSTEHPQTTSGGSYGAALAVGAGLLVFVLLVARARWRPSGT